MPYLDDLYNELTLPAAAQTGGFDPIAAAAGIGQQVRGRFVHPLYGTPLSRAEGGWQRPTRELGPEARYILGTTRALEPGRAELEERAQRNQADILAAIYREVLGPLAREELAAGRVADLAGFEQALPRIAGAGGTADIDTEIQRQLLEELSAGPALRPIERQELQQSVRRAQSARGFGLGRNDAAEEALAEYLGGSALRLQRLGRAMDYSAVRNRGLTDLLGALTGQPSASVGTSAALYSQTQPRLPATDPFQNQFARDLFSTAQGQYWANVFSKRQKAAADNAALMQLIGSIIEGTASAGGQIGAAAICWVAREVFGPRDVRWRLFRHWLTHQGPHWLYRLYLRYGEQAAAFVRGKPRLKASIGRWMEARIAQLPARINH